MADIGSVTAGGTFVMDTGAIGAIAKGDPGLMAAVDAAAAGVAAGAGPKAKVEYYTTDRHVAGVVVPAIEQAKHGRLTKALGINGGRLDHAAD
jgi:hypothetical protein